MKRLKYLLMMAAMAITLCVGFTACGDEDDDEDTASGSIKVSGADWSFSELFFCAEENDSYMFEVGFVMQGKNNGKTFCLSWFPDISDLSDGEPITSDTFEISLGSIYGVETSWICDYKVVSGYVIATEVTSNLCTVKFNDLKLRMYDSTDTEHDFPQTVTLNGTATFKYSQFM